MTFVQLQYIVALDTYRHFATAAEQCHVTQPTLSMQINKLEQELGVKLFDRSKQPVLPTESGISFVEKARRILAGRDELLESIQSTKGIVDGELRLGIIPTVAPYLLPLFVSSFTQKFPQVKLTVIELVTKSLITRLRDGRIDAGILVTPLQEQGISEDVLFYEELVAYVSKNNKAFKKSYVLARGYRS
jgi:LysR family hydrogen peroxide-inducible transcriptional activator